MLASLLNRFLAACRSLPDSPPSDCGCDVISYALYEHELYQKNFDGLDAKASGIMQFVAIVLGLSAFQARLTADISWCRIASLAAFAVALVLAIGAWWVRGAEGVPKACLVRDRLLDCGPKQTQQELIEKLAESSNVTRTLCLKKARLLAWSFSLLLIGVVLLIVSLCLR